MPRRQNDVLVIKPNPLKSARKYDPKCNSVPRDAQGVVENPVWVGLKATAEGSWMWGDYTPLLWSQIGLLAIPLPGKCIVEQGLC